MMLITLMTRRIFMQNSYTKYTRYFNDGNILGAEEKLHNIKYNLRKPRISPVNISTWNIYVISSFNLLQ